MTVEAVILAGGLGTRLREETEFKPKPMVQIGSMPIIWHIMMNLSQQGIKKFIVCLGYKGEVIRDFFYSNSKWGGDHILKFTSNGKIQVESIGDSSHLNTISDWEIILADTGLNTPTGGRIKKIEKYIESDTFLLTYGDGLSDINLNNLKLSHLKSGNMLTITAVNPDSRFGTLRIEDDLSVSEFEEKPSGQVWINGGFMLMSRGIFHILSEESILEKESIRKLVAERLVGAYKHYGFWQCMDTYRESQKLNEIWDSGKAPWCNW